MYADRVDARALASSGRRESVVTITRTGEFFDPRYGRFEITPAMLSSMIDNFNRRVTGQDVFVDKTHEADGGAAGTIRELFLDHGKLRARVEWTPYGLDLIENRGFTYLSAEYHENWLDNERREPHGPTLLGAALTIRPVIKHLDPIELSEDSLWECRTYITDRLQKLLSEECEQTMKDFLKKLREALAAKKLSEKLIDQLATAFEQAAGHIGDDKERLEKLLSQFVETGEGLAKQLAEASGAGEIKLTIDIPEPKKAGDQDGAAKTLSEEDVKKILADAQAAAAKQQRELTEQRDENMKLFSEMIDNAEGLKDLDEETLAEIKKAGDLITAGMDEDQVKRLAAQQISLGNRMAAAAKLAARGFQRSATGSVRIVKPDEDKHVVELQEEIDKRVGYHGMADSERFARTGGKLLAKNKQLAEAVLKTFDAERGAQLEREHKQLAGGDGDIGDVVVPGIYERTVIREALYSLVSLQFVDSGTYPFSQSATIPYSYRDTTGAGKSDTRVFEGGSIPRAGVIQTSELAYPTPQKLAFEVSDELRYLTRDSIYNWDAVAENVRNAVRIVGEDTEQLNFNAVLAASHEYGAVAVTDEDLELHADDTNEIFVLDNFPVVRPRMLYDLQGNAIGNVINPVTVTYSGTALDPYDGTGTQAAGTYYVLDYDLGEIYLTDESGAVQVPANGTAYTISYSYVTNAYAFDTDEGADTTKDHWDRYLYRFGLRKSEIESARYHMANFAIMSENYKNQVEQAGKFAANFRVPGTDLSSDGSLGRIKSIPTFNTTAPGLNIGDRYAIIGERGVTRFRMMKAWMMNQLENQKDSNGRFTGKKEAYGDQFVVVHTPTQLKRAYTSIMQYSASARVDRVAS
jgi:hypothetical protein